MFHLDFGVDERDERSIVCCLTIFTRQSFISRSRYLDFNKKNLCFSEAALSNGFYCIILKTKSTIKSSSS